MSTVIHWGEVIKDAGAVKYGEPPYGHAELSSFKLFCKKQNIDLEHAKILLAQANIRFDNDDQSIGDLAKMNSKSPKDIFEIIKPAEIKTDKIVFPDVPFPGFGRKKLAEICSEYNLHIPVIIRALSENGVTSEPAMSIIEIAEKNGKEPMTIFELIREAAILPK